MLGVSAYVLDRLTIRNLGFAYFFLSPLFLNQGNRFPVLIIFSLSHLFTFSIVSLFLVQKIVTFDHRIRFQRMDYLIFGLMAVFLASVLFNTPAHLLNVGKYHGWYLKFALPALTFLILTRIWQPRDIPRLYGLLVAMGVCSVIILIPQVTLDVPPVMESGRYSSFYLDPNGYVLLLDVILAFAFPTFLHRVMTGRPYAAQASAVLALIVLVAMTGSRGGFLITGSIIAISILATRNYQLVLGACILAVPLAVGGALIVVGRYDSGAELSDMGRIWSYVVAMGMIRENPLLGIGFGNVLERFGEFGKIFSIAMGRPLEIHNAFLEIFAEGGLGAFLIFAAMLFIPFGILFKRSGFPIVAGYPLLSIAGLNIMSGIIIYCFFYPEFLGHDDFWAYFVLVFLILRSKVEIPAELIPPSPSKPGPAAGVLSSP